MSSESQQVNRHGVGGAYVDTEMCEGWRERYESVKGRSMRDIAEEDGVPESTVRDHIIGRCQHSPAKRGVHDIREGDDREAVLDAMETLLDRNYGDTLYTKAGTIKSQTSLESPGQKARAVLGEMAEKGDIRRGLKVKRSNPSANTARYAITRVETEAGS